MTNQSPFAAPPLSPEAEELRREVRDFLKTELAGTTALRRAESWNGWSAEFSAKMGERGWIGMTWPKRYGGHERSALERYVVLEEMLAHGAPVSAHWIADRQSGPLLLRSGTEKQRLEVLPRIAAGTCFVCIGLRRAGCRLRSGVGANAGRTGRRRLPCQRHQDLDHQRPSQPLHGAVLPDRRRQRATSRG